VTSPTSSYVKREIDAQLWHACKEWQEYQTPIQWISVVSSPGNGNTALLENLRLQIEQDQGSLGQSRVIFAPGAGSSPDQPPALLDPISRAIFDIYCQSKQRWQMRLLTQLAHYQVLRRLRNVCLIFISCVFVVILRAKPDSVHLFTRAWWRFVGGKFEPEPLVVDLIFAVIGALILELFRKPEKKEERKQPEHPELDPESFCNSSPDLFITLEKLCHRHWELILIVDDAYALPPSGIQFLCDLCHPSPSRKEIRRLRKTQRILVITLDLENSKRDFPREFNRYFKRLPGKGVVRPFTRLELQHIAHTNKNPVPENELEWVLDLAEQNVNAIFLNDVLEVRERVITEYEAARERRIPGIFGLCELMAYWAVRQVSGIKKSELLHWIRNLDPGHQAFFQIEAPQQYQALLTEFFASSLIGLSTETTVSFDSVACQTFRKWLAETEQGKAMLLQAHCYWQTFFAQSLVSVNGQSLAKELVPSEVIAVKQAAWHATSMRKLLQEMSATVADNGGLTPPKQMQLTHNITLLLLRAAALWSLDGELKRSSIMIQEALDCLKSCDTDGEPLLLLASHCLWSNFWLAANEFNRESLQRLGKSYVELTQLPHWIVQQQFDEFLRGSKHGKLSEQPAEVETLDHADLINIAHLTGTLRAIRETHGFASEGLRDRSILVPEPLPFAVEGWAEHALWELRAAAFDRREQWDEMESVFQKWRRRIAQDERANSPLRVQAYQEFHYARYSHSLLECWKLRSMAAIGMKEREQEKFLQELQNWLLPHCLTTPAGEMQESLFAAARSHYQRGLQIAALLGLHTLMLEAGFQFGDLLLRFTSQEEKKSHPFWWKEWFGLFEGCLVIEGQSGWNVHAPDIHRLCWNFFQEEGRTTSVSDAYNVLQSAKRSGFPDTVILEWHEKVSGLLTNYGNSREDRKRSAQLHEMWADQLAHLDAAASHRKFHHSLLLEKASSLQFAAQDERLLEDFSRAEELLDRADSLYQDALASEHGEDPEEVRDLGISLRMQRAWLANDRDDDPGKTRQLILDLWHDLWPECQHFANVLGTFVGLEEREKILDEPWPPAGGRMHLDPDNQSLSLPEEWFYQPSAVHLENRFEFRLHQLLHMVSENPEPSYAELAFVASRLGWHGQEHFGETVIALAEIDLRRQYSNKSRKLCVTLLQAVAFDFHNIKNEEKEMTSYRLLMKYDPKADEFRIKYIEVLMKYKELLQRELRVLGFERTDWLGTVQHLNYYFSVLVDEDLLNTKMSERIGRTRETLERYRISMQLLQEKLTNARAQWTHGEYAVCLNELEGTFALPQDWISLSHLEALDLWLKCASIVPQAADLIGKRAANLRSLAMQYVAQIAATIKDSQAQQLAVELMQALEQPHTAQLSTMAAVS
jgi:hypothetical protein